MYCNSYFGEPERSVKKARFAEHHRPSTVDSEVSYNIYKDQPGNEMIIRCKKE